MFCPVSVFFDVLNDPLLVLGPSEMLDVGVPGLEVPEERVGVSEALVELDVGVEVDVSVCVVLPAGDEVRTVGVETEEA